MAVDAGALSVAAHVVSELLLDAPDDTLLSTLHDAEAAENWPLGDAASRQALQEIAAAREHRELLVDDQFQLFVGPGRGTACPFESVQLSEEQLLEGDETFAVRDMYAHLGLVANPRDPMPDDHIGLEFAYVAEAAARLDASLLADERSAVAQLLRVFLAEHLDPLCAAVLPQVSQHARTVLYRRLPDLAKAVLVAAHEAVDSPPAGERLR